MSQMLKSSGAMTGATLISRVLGMVRDIFYTQFMGTGWVADAFNLAFMVPNLFRRLLGEGALTAAFIPIFKEKEKLSGETEMWRAANAVLSALVAAASILVALAVAGITLVLLFHQGGLEPPSGDGRTLLLLELLRLMFPYVLLVCLAALFIGILNSRGYFFVPAMGAAMLNVVMIASVLWLAPRMGDRLEQQIFGLAIGVVIAGIAQAAFQLPLLRKEGLRLEWISPWRNETVCRVVTKMIPGAVGVAAFQINVLLTQSIAFWAGVGVVSSFTVAVRLMELPQGGFGLSLAAYLLPALSGLAAEQNYPEFRASLRHGLSWLLFVNLLASAMLFTLAEPMIRLLFERGQFDEISTANSALALRCLAPGLVCFSVVNILARAFYALGDTSTPMRISVFCLALNVALAAALVVRFKQAGLGIANTLSATLNMALLLYALRRKLKTLELAALIKPLAVLTAAALIAGAVAWELGSLWNARIGHHRLWLRAGEVFVPITTASLVYVAVSVVFKTGHLSELLGLFRRKTRPASNAE
jgi:putative peptidoglycan lipid II flippase